MSSPIVEVNRKRLELCKPPLFPGSASSYRYLPERCVRVSPKKSRARTRSNSNSKSKSKQEENKRVDRRELAALQAITGDYADSSAAPQVTDLSDANYLIKAVHASNIAVTALFRDMISQRLRASTPDPVKRMANLLHPNRTFGAKAKLAVRQRVFVLMEAHLAEIIGATGRQP